MKDGYPVGILENSGHFITRKQGEVTFTSCSLVQMQHLAICTMLPKHFPDKQGNPIILLGGLPSVCSQEEEKIDIGKEMGRDPKINRDTNTWYLIFQERLLKNDYRSDIHVAGEWVIASLNLLVLGQKLRWWRSGIKSFAAGIFTSFTVNKDSFTNALLHTLFKTCLVYLQFSALLSPFVVFAFLAWSVLAT